MLVVVADHEHAIVNADFGTWCIDYYFHLAFFIVNLPHYNANGVNCDILFVNSKPQVSSLKFPILACKAY